MNAGSADISGSCRACGRRSCRYRGGDSCACEYPLPSSEPVADRPRGITDGPTDRFRALHDIFCRILDDTDRLGEIYIDVDLEYPDSATGAAKELPDTLSHRRAL